MPMTLDHYSTWITNNWNSLLTPVLVFCSVTLAAWIAQRIIFSMFRRWAERTSTNLDDILLNALRKPMLLWAIMLGLHFGFLTSPLSDSLTRAISRTLLVLWILSLTYVGASLASDVVRVYGGRVQGRLQVTSLVQNVTRIVVFVLGGLVLLNALGVPVTPVLTALGVGGLAVALALQDTLANLFSGIYISIAGNLRVGDFVKLDSGEEGYITDINWRVTTIRQLPNNLVIVPNAKLAQAIVTNYYLPEPRMSLLMPIGVSYDADPDHVERVLLEEAKGAVGTIPGLLGEPEPVVRFISGFGDSSLDFTLICQVKEFTDQYLAQSELRKRIFKRFRREGIEIPFPVRTVYLRRSPGDSEQPATT